MPLLFLMSIDTKRQRKRDRTQSTLEMHKSKIFEHLELRVGE